MHMRMEKVRRLTSTLKHARRGVMVDTYSRLIICTTSHLHTHTHGIRVSRLLITVAPSCRCLSSNLGTQCGAFARTTLFLQVYGSGLLQDAAIDRRRPAAVR